MLTSHAWAGRMFALCPFCDISRRRLPATRRSAARRAGARAGLAGRRDLLAARASPARRHRHAGDGPKVDACAPPRRLRLPAADPNRVERAALYLALGEFLAPEPPSRLATIDTPGGRHTLPVEREQAGGARSAGASQLRACGRRPRDLGAAADRLVDELRVGRYRLRPAISEARSRGRSVW